MYKGKLPKKGMFLSTKLKTNTVKASSLVPKKKMDEIVKNFPESKSSVVSADLTDVNEYEKICSKILDRANGSIDLLVNNAGGTKWNTKTQTTGVAEFEWNIRLNLTSCFALTKFLMPGLERAKGFSTNICTYFFVCTDFKNDNTNFFFYSDGCARSVVNMGSFGAVATIPVLTPYSVAKAGVAHLTRLQAIEFAPKTVRINCVQPATVKTQFHRSAGLSEEEARKYYEVSNQMHPIGRVGTCTDVAEVILFLADPNKSGWITGQCITLDGGRSLQAAFTNSQQSKM
ncbi:hypothetical protein RFI_26811 [Reticulomyxa filosa]|uniref:Short-chain dehydrogenase/reductase SDR n=1 Tax=Reticulomyxa filosa TaxID=46433 RepID=X6MA63_RETFI|nr:hypothetical protein RFI_26811 [Reticulomyxa filosa]|eukprot:ETO10556.1 hypothetical protein RFI_26811 [Reticulomyxa filosa]